MRAINGRKIKAWMVLHELTQQAVAAEAGFSQSFVSQYLRGKYGSRRLTEYFIGKGCPPRHFEAANQEAA